MPAVTIRHLPPEVHRALKARARGHRRSTEAEIRAILEAAVSTEEPVRIGTALRRLAQQYHGVDLQLERDKTPAHPVSFE